MGHYHVNIKVAKKEGCSTMRASSHYAYLGRTGAFEKLRSQEELVQIESGNMPSWAEQDAAIFWLASDSFERENGSVYRELEAALPRELSLEQQKSIIVAFREKVLKGHPYTSAIHIKNASDGKLQPHVHLMWSERKLDGIDRDSVMFFKRAAAARKGKNGEVSHYPDIANGGCRKVSMQPRLDEFRELWATLVNEAYRKAEVNEQVSHLSLANQGINREPERHLGPIRMHTEDGEKLLARRKAQKEAHAEEAYAQKIIDRTANMRRRRDLIQDLVNCSAEKNELTVVREGTFNTGQLHPAHGFVKFQAKNPSKKFTSTSISLPAVQHALNPRAYPSGLHYAKVWRSKALLKQYGLVSDLIATYWRMRVVKNRQEVIYEQKNAENRVVDQGNHITAKNGNESEIAIIIELAKIKKWPAIIFTGSEDFKARAIIAALKSGLDVNARNPDDEKLLEKIKSGFESLSHRRQTEKVSNVVRP